MRLKNMMNGTRARCLGKCLAFAFIVIGVTWLFLIIDLYTYAQNSTSHIVLHVVMGIWNCVTGALSNAITKERIENGHSFGRVFMFFAIVSALLGAFIVGVYTAALEHDDQFFSLRSKDDSDGPDVIFIILASWIVGPLECVFGICAVILYCTMNPDCCSLYRINNQQVQHITHSANCTTTERPTEVFGGGPMHEGYEMVTAQASRDLIAGPARILMPLYEERSEGQRQFFQGSSFEATFSPGNRCQLPERPPIITYV